MKFCVPFFGMSESVSAWWLQTCMLESVFAWSMQICMFAYVICVNESINLQAEEKLYSSFIRMIRKIITKVYSEMSSITPKRKRVLLSIKKKYEIIWDRNKGMLLKDVTVKYGIAK